MGKSSNPEYSIRERIRVRVNAKANYEVSIELGECYRCHVLCEINPRTGKPYHACGSCRKEHEENKRRRNDSRAGISSLENQTEL